MVCTAQSCIFWRNNNCLVYLTFRSHCHLLQQIVQVFRSVECFRDGDVHSVVVGHTFDRVHCVHPDHVRVFLCNNSDTIPRESFHYSGNRQTHFVKRSQESGQRLKHIIIRQKLIKKKKHTSQTGTTHFIIILNVLF